MAAHEISYLLLFYMQPTQGSHLREKKSRLRKSENAVRLLYTKTVTSHIEMRLVFSFFCTHQRRFVEHLPWV